MQQFFAEHAPDIDIIELNQSTATVALAAEAYQIEPGQIAKTLSLKVKNDIILIVACGDARLDNKKLKKTFSAKARMLASDEVVSWTGHPAGGVCPFGQENPLAVYCDVSLKQHLALSKVLWGGKTYQSVVIIRVIFLVLSIKVMPAPAPDGAEVI